MMTSCSQRSAVSFLDRFTYCVCGFLLLKLLQVHSSEGRVHTCTCPRVWLYLCMARAHTAWIVLPASANDKPVSNSASFSFSHLPIPVSCGGSSKAISLWQRPPRSGLRALSVPFISYEHGLCLCVAGQRVAQQHRLQRSVFKKLNSRTQLLFRSLGIQKLQSCFSLTHSAGNSRRGTRNLSVSHPPRSHCCSPCCTFRISPSPANLGQMEVPLSVRPPGRQRRARRCAVTWSRAPRAALPKRGKWADICFCA